MDKVELREPFVIASEDHRTAIEYIQTTWVTNVGADPAAHSLSQSLRVPYTLNHKYTPARPVMPVLMDITYTHALADFTAQLPPPPPPKIAAPPVSLNTTGKQPITQFNQEVLIGNLLERYGYRWHGRNRMVSPHSGSKRDGVSIDIDTNRCFVFTGGDPLADGYWKTPFDVVMILDYHGDRHRALAAIRTVLP